MPRFGYFYCQLAAADLLSLRQAVVRSTTSAEPQALNVESARNALFTVDRSTRSPFRIGCSLIDRGDLKCCSHFQVESAYL